MLKQQRHENATAQPRPGASHHEVRLQQHALPACCWLSTDDSPGTPTRRHSSGTRAFRWAAAATAACSTIATSINFCTTATSGSRAIGSSASRRSLACSAAVSVMMKIMLMLLIVSILLLAVLMAEQQHRRVEHRAEAREVGLEVVVYDCGGQAADKDLATVGAVHAVAAAREGEQGGSGAIEHARKRKRHERSVADLKCRASVQHPHTASITSIPHSSNFNAAAHGMAPLRDSPWRRRLLARDGPLDLHSSTVNRVWGSQHGRQHSRVLEAHEAEATWRAVPLVGHDHAVRDLLITGLQHKSGKEKEEQINTCMSGHQRANREWASAK